MDNISGKKITAMLLTIVLTAGSIPYNGLFAFAEDVKVQSALVVSENEISPVINIPPDEEAPPEVELPVVSEETSVIEETTGTESPEVIEEPTMADPVYPMYVQNASGGIGDWLGNCSISGNEATFTSCKKDLDKRLIIPEKLIVTDYNGQEDAILLECNWDETELPVYTVTTLAEDCFTQGSLIPIISLPNTLTCDITSEFFANCSSLTSITVERLNGEECKRYYDGWNSSAISKGVLIDLQTQTIICCPQRYAQTAYEAPAYIDILKIAPRAFYKCANLKTIKIPDAICKVTEVGEEAFAESALLTSVLAFGDAISKIGDRAFYNCSSLGTLALPNGNDLVFGTGVFSGTAITTLKLPSNTLTISGETFRGALKLQSLTIGTTNTHYTAENGILYNKPGASEAKRMIVYPAAKSGTEFRIPYGVTEFDDYAISNCKNIVKLTFPSDVYTLSENTIESCTRLRYVYAMSGFPDLPHALGYTSLFKNCVDELSRITIYAGGGTVASEYATAMGHTFVELYGEDEFETTILSAGGKDYARLTGHNYNSAHKDVVVPDFIVTDDSVLPTTKVFITGVGPGAFSNENITSITFMANMQDVDPNAFRIAAENPENDKNATNLANIYIEEGNQSLSSVDGVLYGKEKSAEGIETVTRLLYYPVGNPRTEFTMYETIKYVPENAFRGAQYLKVVNIYDNVLYIGYKQSDGTRDESAAFNGCKSLVAINLLNTTDTDFLETDKKYASHQGVLYSKENGVIHTLLFYPKGLRSPQNTGSFSTTYTVQEDCVEIKDFRDCIYLMGVIIPASVQKIDSDAFQGCSSLTTVTFQGTGIKSIGDRAFMNTRIGNLTLPGSITDIGEEAFSGCSQLTSVTVAGDVLTSVGDYAFKNCARLQTVTIKGTKASNNGDVAIGESAFSGCRALTAFRLENMNSASISDNALAYNSVLKTASFDQTDIISLGVSTFEQCISLETADLHYSDSLGTLGKNVFKGCQKLKTVVLPYNLARIDEGAFEGCTSLSEINLEEMNYLARIQANAFKSCSFSVLRLPDSLTTIEDRVFEACPNLVTVSIPASTVNILGDPFYGIETQVTVYGVLNSVANLHCLDKGIRFVSGDIPNVKVYISLVEKTIFDVGENKVQLFAVTDPEGGDIIWRTSDSDIADLDPMTDGLVVAKKPGTVEIYAISKQNGARASCTITVLATSVNIIDGDDGNPVILNTRGTNHTLLMNVTSVPLRKIMFKSSNNMVASVNKNGRITGLRSGVATIVAMAGQGDTYREDTLTVTVIKPVISLDRTRVTLNEKGEADKLTCQLTTLQLNGASKEVVWKSSNPFIAKVSQDGLVTALRAGKTVITATANGISASCAVTVKPVSIKLNATKKILYYGDNSSETALLKAAVSGINKNVTWASDHEEYAMVDENGLVTANSKGTATITATCNGVSATCVVVVIESAVTILNSEGATLYPSTLLINSKGNNKYDLNVRIDGRNQKASWTSSSRDIAIVNYKGLVQGKSGGEAVVTAEANGVRSECLVTVVDTYTELDYTQLTLYSNGQGTDKLRTITATIEGADLARNVKWSTSNSEVISISNEGTRALSNQTTYGGQASANITALKEGTAIIYVTANGVTAQCKVTVKKDVDNGE